MIDFGDVPGADDVATRTGIVADRIHNLGDLIDVATVWGRPTAPLVSVHMSQISVLIGPFVPNGHSVFMQVTQVGISAKKP